MRQIEQGKGPESDAANRLDEVQDGDKAEK